MSTPLKRTRIVNDPADLVPILQSLGSKNHKQVFDLLLSGWKSEEELQKLMGSEAHRSLEVLRRGGLLESKWRMPQPGTTPDKEYHSSYSAIRANFQCSLEDIADIVMILFMDDEGARHMADQVVKEIESGKKSIAPLCRSLGVNPTFLKGLAHRTSRFMVKGNRVDVLNEEE
ncbi:MAG: ArsR family transcriptional regulator [Euryarchaeota archaeon]|nr:ArsR family transcriptional regulator [Euryarchaeota archaeon]